MEALKKRINLNKKADEHKRIYDIIIYSNDNNNIFDWLKGILYIEEKTKRYKDLVLRLFLDYLDYLESIKSKDIIIKTDYGKKNIVLNI